MENKLTGLCSSVNRNNWKVIIDNREVSCIINSRYKGETLPTVGDVISVIKDDYDTYIISDIESRKNKISRYLSDGSEQLIAVNLDIVFIITSPNNEFNLGKLERFYLLANRDNIDVYFIINKSDLVDNIKDYSELISKKFKTDKIILSSTITNEGIEEILDIIKKDKTVVFIGSSGVGKSSIINSLRNNEQIKTTVIREKDSKGRHTTTSRNLYPIGDNSYIIDTPGVRGVDSEIYVEDINKIYENISALEPLCKFNDCAHISEIGCAVMDAVNKGIIDHYEYTNYLKMTKKIRNKQITKGEIKLSKHEAEKIQKFKKSQNRKR